MKKKELLKKYEELMLKLECQRLDIEKLSNHVKFLTFKACPCPSGYIGRFTGDWFSMDCVKPDKISNE